MNADTDSLPEEFMAYIRDLERHYLMNDDPIKQSGFYGGAERWRRERGIVLDAIEQDGDFLDAACANGYLLECLVDWAREKGIVLTPYGLDIGPRLIELARRRLPAFADHFWVGNSWTWEPPQKFHYVYTLHHCVPENLLGECARRLLGRCVAGGGRLIIGAYVSKSEGRPARDLAPALQESGLAVAGSASCGELPVTRVAWVDKLVEQEPASSPNPTDLAHQE